jgi:hypothetical protein
MPPAGATLVGGWSSVVPGACSGNLSLLPAGPGVASPAAPHSCLDNPPNAFLGHASLCCHCGSMRFASFLLHSRHESNMELFSDHGP